MKNHNKSEKNFNKIIINIFILLYLFYIIFKNIFYKH